MASQSTESISDPPGLPLADGAPCGYPLQILDEKLDPKYQCGLCLHVLRDPVQSFCGHRFCKRGVQQLLARCEGKQLGCPSCEKEERDADLDELGTLNQTLPDYAIKREFMTLPVHCFHCGWKGNLKQYDMSEHDRGTCSERLVICPYGCRAKVDPSKAKQHAMESVDAHLEALTTEIRKLEATSSLRVQGLSGEAGDASVPHRVDHLRLRVQHLEEELERSSANVVAVQNLADHEQPRTEGHEDSGAVGGVGTPTLPDLEKIKQDVENRIATFESVAGVVNQELLALIGRVEELERQQNSARDLVKAATDKVQALEQRFNAREQAITDHGLRLDNLEGTTYNGVLVWKIPNFSRRREEAIRNQVLSFYSPAFYTNKNVGYKMCARIYLNGDGMGKGTHISLFFVLMRGEFDALLRWPFRQKVSLTFVDQNNRQHVVDAFRPDPTSTSFRKPVSDMNVASGCPLFMPLSALESQGYGYVKEDAAFIKIEVDISDIPHWLSEQQTGKK